MRAPSISIQHSCASAVSAEGYAAELSSSLSVASNFLRLESSGSDNSFPAAGFYLHEHRLCSLHLGSFGSPFFHLASRMAEGDLCRRLPLLPQQLLQHANPLVHMLLLQQIRRQKADDRVLRAVEQNALS